jgi:hypothetical protein
LSGTHENILKQIKEEWADLKAQLSKVPANRMDEGGVVGPWSVKDIVGHITTWERQAITAVSNYIAESDTAILAWKDDLDGFNLQAVDDTRSKTLDDLMTSLDQTHSELLAFVAGVPGDALSVDGVINRIQEDTFDHYAEHTASIRQWLDTEAEPS